MLRPLHVIRQKVLSTAGLSFSERRNSCSSVV
jgi:hypothetical protein